MNGGIGDAMDAGVGKSLGKNAGASLYPAHPAYLSSRGYQWDRRVGVKTGVTGANLCRD
jgi:hypothetical protein